MGLLLFLVESQNELGNLAWFLFFAFLSLSLAVLSCLHLVGVSDTGFSDGSKRYSSRFYVSSIACTVKTMHGESDAKCYFVWFPVLLGIYSRGSLQSL